MKHFIRRTPIYFIVLIISCASSVFGVALVPIIMHSPGESFLEVAALVVIPSFFISMIVSSPVVYFYRKIINENFHMIEALQKDHLTGLLNRHTFVEQYQNLLNDLKDSHRTLTLIMLDIDNFKKINDVYGHPGGDAVISAVANLLKNNMRKDDLICRFGGEEFLIVLKDMSYEQSIVFGQQLLHKTRSSITYNSQLISFTVSIGLAFFEDCSLDPDQYILIADHTMYLAKALGKNQLVSNVG